MQECRVLFASLDMLIPWQLDHEAYAHPCIETILGYIQLWGANSVNCTWPWAHGFMGVMSDSCDAFCAQIPSQHELACEGYDKFVSCRSMTYKKMSRVYWPCGYLSMKWLLKINCPLFPLEPVEIENVSFGLYPFDKTLFQYARVCKMQYS